MRFHSLTAKNGFDCVGTISDHSTGCTVGDGFEVLYDPQADHKCGVPRAAKKNMVVMCSECGTKWFFNDSIFYEGVHWARVRWYHFRVKGRVNG